MQNMIVFKIGVYKSYNIMYDTMIYLIYSSI